MLSIFNEILPHLGSGNGVTDDDNSGVSFGSDGSGVGNRSISLGNEGNYKRKSSLYW